MPKPSLPAHTLGFYRLPLATGSCRLSMATLNQHSEFRYTGKPYLYHVVTKQGFEYGLLHLKVWVERETPAQLVYLCVVGTELWVACDAGTTEDYLSKHAYMALYSFMSYPYEGANFEKYNWSDFFTPGQKKSKYLDVVCDRQGLDIELKEKYLSFWKPGHQLHTIATQQSNPMRRERKLVHTNNSSREEAFGYLLADPIYPYRYCNHLPFLAPYVGSLNKPQTAMKNYSKLIAPVDAALLELSETQVELNAIAFAMAAIAWLPFREQYEKETATSELLEKTHQLFGYWHKALPLLQGQRYTAHYHTMDREPLAGKPLKRRINPCMLAFEAPKLCFTWRNKGDYFELSLRFKVNGQIFEPHEIHTLFFIRSAAVPTQFYLLDNLEDMALLQFFYLYKKCGLSVLKLHYAGAFERFLKTLKERYEFV
jgi:hypothetical protein